MSHRDFCCHCVFVAGTSVTRSYYLQSMVSMLSATYLSLQPPHSPVVYFIAWREWGLSPVYPVMITGKHGRVIASAGASQSWRHLPSRCAPRSHGQALQPAHRPPLQGRDPRRTSPPALLLGAQAAGDLAPDARASGPRTVQASNFPGNGPTRSCAPCHETIESRPELAGFARRAAGSVRIPRDSCSRVAVRCLQEAPGDMDPSAAFMGMMHPALSAHATAERARAMGAIEQRDLLPLPPSPQAYTHTDSAVSDRRYNRGFCRDLRIWGLVRGLARVRTQLGLMEARIQNTARKRRRSRLACVC